ncbi:hypothetical protein [Myxosarcina sp. GI1(2024)]
MINLGKKRVESLSAIARYAVGGGTLAAAPLLGGEIPKQIALTASDIFMYVSIWRIYFEEDLSHKELFEVLKEIGIITIAATGTAYVVAKGSSALLSEICNRFGPVGWGIVATITGSLTGLCGLLWILYCDFAYEYQRKSRQKSAGVVDSGSETDSNTIRSFKREMPRLEALEAELSGSNAFG